MFGLSVGDSCRCYVDRNVFLKAGCVLEFLVAKVKMNADPTPHTSLR